MNVLSLVTHGHDVLLSALVNFDHFDHFYPFFCTKMYLLRHRITTSKTFLIMFVFFDLQALYTSIFL